MSPSQHGPDRVKQHCGCEVPDPSHQSMTLTADASASLFSPALDPSPPNDTSLPYMCLKGCLGHSEELNNFRLNGLSSKTCTLGISSPDWILY